MSTIEPLCFLARVIPYKLSKQENLLLEAELFSRIYIELKNFFGQQHKDFFRLMNFTVDMEDTMLEANLLRFIIQDILLTEMYTLQGISYYSDTHEDVLQEIINGRNTSPSVKLFRRMVELHREVKRDFYHAMIKKIMLEYAKQDTAIRYDD